MARLMEPTGSGASRLRWLLKESFEPILAPGAYDALSARLIEEAGFPVVYMTGFGTSASLLGRPDVGLLTMTEMVDNARRIVQAVNVPVIADADTGYGNPINVIRTVKEYEAAGVAGIHIEDQVLPKKCGHMEGKQLISSSVMVTKLKAAVAARRSPDFIIIARTDARAVEGLEAAIERGKAYRDAGAEMIFVEAPQSKEEIAAVSRAFPDVPLFYNWAEAGKSPPMPLEELKQLGFRIVIFPISALLTATQAIRRTLTVIKETGSPIPVLPELGTFSGFLDFIGLPEIRELEQRYRETGT